MPPPLGVAERGTGKYAPIVLLHPNTMEEQENIAREGEESSTENRAA